MENNYDTEVFNGDLGMVISQNPKQQSIEVRLMSPHLTYLGLPPVRIAAHRSKRPGAARPEP